MKTGRNRNMKNGFSTMFNKELIQLVVPIALHNLVSASVVIADILMLGMVSQDAMSAVFLGGQVKLYSAYFILDWLMV